MEPEKVYILFATKVALSNNFYKKGVNMVERIGVSIPKNLLGKFDSFINKKGYANRSEGIRDAIRDFLSEPGIDLSGDGVGTISVFYDHHIHHISDFLTEVQHDFENIVLSSIHFHLSHDTCLEIIVVRGNFRRISVFASRIKAKKGINQVKIQIMGNAQISI